MRQQHNRGVGDGNRVPFASSRLSASEVRHMRKEALSDYSGFSQGIRCQLSSTTSDETQGRSRLPGRQSSGPYAPSLDQLALVLLAVEMWFSATKPAGFRFQ